MKLFTNTVYAVVQAIDEIFNDNRYADKVIERTLKSNPKVGGERQGLHCGIRL
jgi:16S rRNA (cytosine967-C5)-methyltransferase